MQKFKVYQVWPKCPSISISGSKCHLMCEHCLGYYLRYMHPAETPAKFERLTEKLSGEGAKGFLVSGGCDKSGKILNLKTMIPVIRKLHQKGYVIKLHTGFVDEETAKELAGAIDIASMEFPGSFSAVEEIFHLGEGVEKYIETFRNLRAAGIKHIVPHVCIGLNHGKVSDEWRAVELLGEIFIPEKIVFIVFIPTPDTPCRNDPLPSPEDVESVIGHARKLLPDTELVLGALRPRFASVRGITPDYIHQVEMHALGAGVSGIEVPSRKTAEFIKKNYEMVQIEAFGALPAEFEARFLPV
ncbi:MAG: radical SAM protein [Thermoplasmata archaeon]|nr:radical SAM protein [Thermoplasmata archaeon]